MLSGGGLCKNTVLSSPVSPPYTKNYCGAIPLLSPKKLNSPVETCVNEIELVVGSERNRAPNDFKRIESMIEKRSEKCDHRNDSYSSDETTCSTDQYLIVKQENSSISCNGGDAMLSTQKKNNSTIIDDYNCESNGSISELNENTSRPPRHSNSTHHHNGESNGVDKSDCGGALSRKNVMNEKRKRNKKASDIRVSSSLIVPDNSKVLDSGFNHKKKPKDISKTGKRKLITKEDKIPSKKSKKWAGDNSGIKKPAKVGPTRFSVPPVTGSIDIGSIGVKKETISVDSRRNSCSDGMSSSAVSCPTSPSWHNYVATRDSDSDLDLLATVAQEFCTPRQVQTEENNNTLNSVSNVGPGQKELSMKSTGGGFGSILKIPHVIPKMSVKPEKKKRVSKKSLDSLGKKKKVGKQEMSKIPVSLNKKKEHKKKEMLIDKSLITPVKTFPSAFAKQIFSSQAVTTSTSSKTYDFEFDEEDEPLAPQEWRKINTAKAQVVKSTAEVKSSDKTKSPKRKQSSCKPDDLSRSNNRSKPKDDNSKKCTTPEKSPVLDNPVISSAAREFLDESDGGTESSQEDAFSWITDPSFAVSAVKVVDMNPPTEKSKNTKKSTPKTKPNDKEPKKSTKEKQLKPKKVKNLFNSSKSLGNKRHHIKPCLKAEPVVRPLGSEQNMQDSDSEIDLEVASILNSVTPVKKNVVKPEPVRKLSVEEEELLDIDGGEYRLHAARLEAKEKKALSSSCMYRSRKVSGRSRSSRSSTTSIDRDSKLRPVPVVPEWKDVSKLEIDSVEDMIDEMRVLTEIQGLFYAGKLNALQPPDVYGVTLDHERGIPPHLIFSAEEVLEVCTYEYFLFILGGR